MKTIIILLLITATGFASGVVATWTGSGSRSTESFLITHNAWRVSWTTDDAIVVSVYNADTDSFVGYGSTKAPGTGYTVIRENGRFYLKVVSFSGQWTITVTEGERE